MIETINITKKFGGITAIKELNITINESGVFGLVGTNGAGKSTLLKLISGILKPDDGKIMIDNESVFENPKIKSKFFYISDEQYFLKNASPEDMKIFYMRYFETFDSTYFNYAINLFGLDKNRKINTFSKGMKKQLSVILALSSKTKYIFCDETFDGLDPVMRQTVKGLFCEELKNRGLTPIIASHNLRELEDICDHIGLLHKGGILFSRTLGDFRSGVNNVQVVIKPDFDINLINDLHIMGVKKSGSIYTLTIKASEQEIKEKIPKYEPIFFEIIPLTFEEIFITETEAKGYDIKKLIV